jgi:hypothetical protein
LEKVKKPENAHNPEYYIPEGISPNPKRFLEELSSKAKDLQSYSY